MTKNGKKAPPQFGKRKIAKMPNLGFGFGKKASSGAKAPAIKY